MNRDKVINDETKRYLKYTERMNRDKVINDETKRYLMQADPKPGRKTVRV